MSNFWKNNTFDLRLSNHNGKTPAGNCELCFLKGKKTLINIIREKPELADWWIKVEEKANATFNKSRTYKDLLELSKLEEKQTSMFDDDGRSCFCHD